MVLLQMALGLEMVLLLAGTVDAGMVLLLTVR